MKKKKKGGGGRARQKMKKKEERFESLCLLLCTLFLHAVVQGDFTAVLRNARPSVSKEVRKEKKKERKKALISS